MPKTEAFRLLQEDRAAFQEFWRTGQSKPFLLERREPVYCVCDVLWTGIFQHLAFALRCTLTGIAQSIPFSSAKVYLYRLMGARIGRHVYIAPGAFLDPFYPQLITLEDDVFLGLGCRLLTHEYTATHFRIGRVTIGKGTVIGFHSSIRCGVKIGKKATIGCDSFVNKDVPDGATVGGIPARILKDPSER
ncbi:MAG: acyltransferase [Elusimicrobiota bacterium]|jgi:acetyltransferase-like isoleucine patch superfamily enzyme